MLELEPHSLYFQVCLFFVVAVCFVGVGEGGGGRDKCTS